MDALDILIETNFMSSYFKHMLSLEKNFERLNHYLSDELGQNVQVLKYLVPLEEIEEEDPRIYLKVLINGVKQCLILKIVHQRDAKNEDDFTYYTKKYHLEDEFKSTPNNIYVRIIYNDDNLKEVLKTDNYEIYIIDKKQREEILSLYQKGMSLEDISMRLNIKKGIIEKILKYNLKKDKER